MSPPPVTPTPRRFLLPKRATHSSQTLGAPPQFQSTPRFGSSSVPRPTQGKEIGVEDVEEEDWLSETSPDDDEDGLDEKRNAPLADSIEVDSDALSAPSEDAATSRGDTPVTRTVHTGGVDMLSPEGSFDEPASPNERQAKRRKVSTSPAADTNSPKQHVQKMDISERGSDDDEGTHSSSDGKGHTGNASFNTHEGRDRHGDATKGTTAQQPVFQAAPRFKATETEPEMEGLPAAFSPQRRGAKYLPDGLAAELQGWLSEVKGWDGVDNGMVESVLKVTVLEIVPGRRMHLVKGETGSSGAPKVRRFILAGDGKLTGLGKRAEVGLGSVVVFEQPVWDVELDDQIWTVACDWSVE